MITDHINYRLPYSRMKNLVTSRKIKFIAKQTTNQFTLAPQNKIVIYKL